MNRLIICCLILSTTFSACQQNENFEDSIERDITIEEVQAVFKEKQSKNIHSRTNESPMDIHWDRAVYKELNVGDGLFFPVNSSANREGKHYISSTGSSKRFSVDYASFSMAYKDEEGKVILEYVLPIATSDTERFTGYLLVSDWQGDAKRKVYYDNGEIIDVVAIYKQTTENSDVNNLRMQGCTITDHWWCVTASSPTGNSYTTCTYEGSTIYCEPPQGLAPSDPCGCDGGGGSSSDPSGPGGLCEHPFIEGMYVDCDEVICSDGYIADGNGNCVQEIVCEGDLVPDGNGDCVADLSKALTPAYTSDDVSNPYDGMQAYDSNGVLYTYNSDLGAWLMPELFTLNNSDDFELEMPTPPTESSIVISLTPIALGEPTVIGEIILAGTTIIVGAIYVYEFAKYLRDAQNTDHCIGMYTICSEEFGYKNMDCSNCLQFCNSQGYWDFERCPLRHTRR